MDGHWEWSEGGDDADTADLAGDAGQDLHGGYAEDGGAGHDDYAEDYGAGHDFGSGDAGHDFGEPGQHLSDGHLGAGGHDDLEEPLGTEHATAEYDESLHDGDAVVHHDGDTEGHGDGGQAGHEDDGGQLHLSDGHIDGASDDGHESTFGTDPDVDASADDPGWHEVQFPEELHLQDPPEPAGGFPWTDADVLGGPDHSQSAAFDPALEHHGPAEPAGLADYEHLEVPPGADPWSLLLGSDDPATSSLATYWAPQ